MIARLRTVGPHQARAWKLLVPTEDNATYYEEVTMPRKQRFKPSRKPKPNPPSEDAMNGNEPSTRVHNDNVEPDAEPQTHSEAPSTEPDVDPPSR